MNVVKQASSWLRNSNVNVVFAIIMVLVIPAVLTLYTVRVPMKPSDVKLNPTPLGYTVSLLIYFVPVVALHRWFRRSASEDGRMFRRSGKFDYRRSAFRRTLLVLIPIGFLLDIIFGIEFLTFEYRGATFFEHRFPAFDFASGGFREHIPLEEFVFYTLGFIAILSVYVWCDEYWLKLYNVPDYKIPPRDSEGGLPRYVAQTLLVKPLLIAISLVSLAWLYKKFGPHPYHAGFPSYFTFLVVASLLPSMLLFRVTQRFINWQAVSFTVGWVVLTSIFWEATLAAPYLWWGYQPYHMMGLFIGAWFGLPIEAVVLRGEADPAFLAAHRPRQARARELGLVVVLREVRADDVLQLRAVERAEQPLGLKVVEVAERAGDALLQPLRVGAAPQHVAIVVALEHQRVEAGQRALDVRRRDADVGEHAEARGAVRQHELHRLARVMRHGERGDLEIADASLFFSVQQYFPDPTEHLALLLERDQGAVGEIDRDAVGRGEVKRAAGVVAVLVRDQDAGEVRRREAEAREALLRVAQVEAAVDQQARAAGFGDQAVAAAAAGEGSEAQDYFSCAYSSDRMRCVVFELSAVPSLLRTCTWLSSAFWLTCTRYCSGLTLDSLVNSFARKPRSEFFTAISPSGSA
jgi:hypothetical protein